MQVCHTDQQLCANVSSIEVNFDKQIPTISDLIFPKQKKC
jgi:hypothetical protein